MRNLVVFSFFFGLWILSNRSIKAQEDKQTIRLSLVKRDPIDFKIDDPSAVKASKKAIKTLTLCQEKGKMNYKISFNKRQLNNLLRKNKLYLTDGVSRTPVESVQDFKSAQKNISCQNQAWHFVFEKKKRSGRFPASIQEAVPQSYTVFVSPH